MSMIKLKLIGFAVICVGCSAVSISILQGQTNPLDNDHARVVQFPKDRSLGVLYSAPLEVTNKERFNWFLPDFKSIGLAQGKVKLPANSLIRLDVALSACSDLSPLSDIPPDSIQGLYFNINSDPKGQFKHIGALTGLRFLSFRSVPLSDGQILKLAGLTNLEDLTCSVYGFQDKGFGIHDRAIRVIARFKKLKRLDLRSNPITDEGLRLLEGCQSLEVLSLDGTKITGAGFDNLLKLPNLKMLSFGSYENGAPVDDEGMKFLCQMRQITSLSLNGTKVTDAGMEHISELDKLENLSLSFTEVSSDGLKFLVGMKNLKSLGFQKLGDKINLDDDAARFLSQVPSLERIIGKWKLSEIGFKHLAKLKKLTSLDLKDIVSDEDLAHIGTMTSLEGLGFHRCPITDEGIAKLVDLENLKNLSLWSTDVTGNSLKAIQQIPNLKHLAIEFKEFGPASNWKLLGEMPGLTSLVIDGDSLDKLAFTAIAKLKNLERLKLSFAPAGPEFFDAVAGLTELKSLDFWALNANDESYGKLSGLKNLEYLDLQGDILDHQLMLLADLPSLRIFQNHSKMLTLDGIEKFKKKSKSLQSFLHPLMRN